MAMAKKDLTAAAQAVTDTGAAAQAVTDKMIAGKKAKEPMKVFSFRGSVQDVDQWRLYASIRGGKVDEFGAAAMKEYIKRHPLSAEEKALFDKRIESKKS